jgi:uncharacterized protein YjbJ (UPF0337 family)
MNRDQLEGNWKQVKGAVKVKWGELTDDELDVIAGNQEALEGKIQERYGASKEEIRKELNELIDNL